MSFLLTLGIAKWVCLWNYFQREYQPKPQDQRGSKARKINVFQRNNITWICSGSTNLVA